MYHPRYNDTILYGIIFSFLIGVLLRSFFHIPGFLYAVVIFFSIILVFAKPKYKLSSLITSLVLISFVCGMLRFDMKDQRQPRDLFEGGEDVVLEGFVVSESEYKPAYQRFVFEVDARPSYKVLVSSDRYPEFYYGDKIRIAGTMQKPSNFITDTGREFDYVQYLAKDEIYYTMSYANTSLLASKTKKGFRSVLFSFKQKFLSAGNRIIPEPESALLGGILLGVKQSLGEELENNFIDTGTIHIVVLSGYNVTIVSEAFVRFFQTIVSKNLALIFGGVGIILFAIITGATTTTVRASVMGLLGLLARLTGRTYEITRMLFLAAFLMVLHNPYVLVFDISFQLSFIATLGLIAVSPLVEKWFWVQKITTRFGIREIVASTIATQIAVFPYIMYRIGTLSVISPLANLLVLPVIPAAMGVGALASFFELLTSLGSNPLSWASYGLLHYVSFVVEKLASFSWSAVTLPYFHWFFILALYGLIAVWVFKFSRNPRILNK